MASIFICLKSSLISVSMMDIPVFIASVRAYSREGLCWKLL